MKRTIKIVSGAVVAVFLFVTIFIISPTIAQTKSEVPVPGAKFNVSSSIKDNLKIYLGKDVLIHLRSGKTFQGYVKSVDEQCAHLERLSGRDFYDVLIRIEDISAIEAKFRNVK